MCSSRQVCTKKAYEDILPLGLLGSPLPMVTDGVHLVGRKPVGGRRRDSASRPNARPPAPPPARAAQSPAPPGPPAPGPPRRRLRAHAPPGPTRAVPADSPHARSPRPSRRPAPPPAPHPGWRKGTPRAPSGTPFLTETSPGFYVASPRVVASRPTFKKTTRTGLGRASPHPPSTAPGPVRPAPDSACQGGPREPQRSVRPSGYEGRGNGRPTTPRG